MVKRDELARVRECLCTKGDGTGGRFVELGSMWGIEALKGRTGWKRTNTICECLYSNAMYEGYLHDRYEHEPIWCN